MPNVTAMSSSFKNEAFLAQHNFNSSGGDAIRLALYDSNANLDATTTAYTATDEVTGTGYTAGGITLTNNGVTLDGTTAVVDFADPTWSSSTITARGCLIYNSSNSNTSISTHDFGSDVSSSSGDFTIQMPTPDSSNGVIRFA